MDVALVEARRRIEDTISDERLRLEMVRALPAIAQAFSQQLGEVHLTSIGGDGASPATLVAGALAQVLEVARAAGIGELRGARASRHCGARSTWVPVTSPRSRRA